MGEEEKRRPPESMLEKTLLAKVSPFRAKGFRLSRFLILTSQVSRYETSANSGGTPITGNFSILPPPF